MNEHMCALSVLSVLSTPPDTLSAHKTLYAQLSSGLNAHKTLNAQVESET